jgi:hypothetical protein
MARLRCDIIIVKNESLVVPSQEVDGARGPSPRPLRKLRPSWDVLDGRQLLSTVGALPAVALSSPPAAAATAAASILQSDSPTAFARYENDLSLAEQHSRVTSTQAGALAQDEEAIDAAIDSANLGLDTTGAEINHVQDIVDGAFVTTGAGSAERQGVERTMTEEVAGASVSPQLIHQTVAQMQVVAKAVHLSSALRASIAHENAILSRALGPNPDTNLGPEAVDRDPLVVYYDAQVTKFVE